MSNVSRVRDPPTGNATARYSVPTGGVTVVSYAPGRRGAVTREACHGIIEAFERADAHPAEATMVLRGAGTRWHAGGERPAQGGVAELLRRRRTRVVVVRGKRDPGRGVEDDVSFEAGAPFGEA